MDRPKSVNQMYVYIELGELNYAHKAIDFSCSFSFLWILFFVVCIHSILRLSVFCHCVHFVIHVIHILPYIIYIGIKCFSLLEIEKKEENNVQYPVLLFRVFFFCSAMCNLNDLRARYMELGVNREKSQELNMCCVAKTPQLATEFPQKIIMTKRIVWNRCGRKQQQQKNTYRTHAHTK